MIKNKDNLEKMGVLKFGQLNGYRKYDSNTEDLKLKYKFKIDSRLDQGWWQICEVFPSKQNIIENEDIEKIKKVLKKMSNIGF